ncbi:MAG TPA: ferredoxin-NADPH reductase [Microbacterium sp.]|nr:ferredoxin-NADPH reductase [Microbacterium sp.]
MRRITHGMYDTLFRAAHLILVTNALVAFASAPLIALLVTTDPSLSWPLIAAAAALAAPAVTAAFGAFRAHREGERSVVRPFLRTLRSTGVRALAVGAAAAGIVTVAAVDVVVLMPTPAGALVAPVLVVVAVLGAATGAVALAALAEAQGTRFRRLVATSAVVAVRRWPFTLASLAACVAQAGVFVAAPALGVGLTASACLYVVWAGSRHSLAGLVQPVAA